MKIFQLNVSVNSGSTGRIAEQIGVKIKKKGGESIIAYSRKNNESKSQTYKIGNKLDIYSHVLQTRLFDNHGLASIKTTKKLVEHIKFKNPDIIHLHNIHGYFLNIKVLFNFLANFNKPVIWTLHDCWSFTGHCANFDSIDCHKWKKVCNKCPKKSSYPKSLLIDNSERNFLIKKRLFNLVEKMVIVTPSVWLKKLVNHSFLNKYPAKVINNGVDLSIFKPAKNANLLSKYNLEGKKIILGVASIWVAHRGIKDFFEMNNLIDNNYKIIMVGLSQKQIETMPKSIIGIKRTENTQELAELYSIADVYVNPTYSDNFPTTNIEALACGTPVVTYNTGGSPEAIDSNTGVVVEKGNVNQLLKAIEKVTESEDSFSQQMCRERAERFFDKEERYQDYIDLYNKLIF